MAALNHTFTASSYYVTDGNTSAQANVNSLADAIETQLDLVEATVDEIYPGNTATALYLVRRNAANTGLEYVSATGGGVDEYKIKESSTASELYGHAFLMKHFLL